MAEDGGNLLGKKDMSHFEILASSVLTFWLYSLEVQLTCVCTSAFSDTFKDVNWGSLIISTPSDFCTNHQSTSTIWVEQGVFATAMLWGDVWCKEVALLSRVFTGMCWLPRNLETSDLWDGQGFLVALHHSPASSLSLYLFSVFPRHWWSCFFLLFL